MTYDSKRFFNHNILAFTILCLLAFNACKEEDEPPIDGGGNTSGVVIPTEGYSTPTSYPGYNLVWADEFSGTTLNEDFWTFEIGDGCPNLCGWGNNELQYYLKENTSFKDGNLVITAKKQDFGTRNYTSSRFISKGKKEFKFGRIDIRAVMPEGKGMWPALWALGSNIDAVSWPACGEIDIMEYAGDQTNRVVSTVHYGANSNQHQYHSVPKFLYGNNNFTDKFHVFSFIWKNDLMEFYVDDELYHTVTPALLNGAPYPFNQEFFFIMNMAVGGNFSGNPDATTVFPQHLIVDYIRVFQ